MVYSDQQNTDDGRRHVIPGWLRRVVHGAADLVLPPRCLSCGMTVSGDGALCAECWPSLRFLGPPLCAACGNPFEFDPGAESLCGSCLAEHPVFDRARSVFVYDSASRGPLLAFKHADRTDAAPTFARLMASAAADLLSEADMIVPVPLHWRRLLARRFNQSALLAQVLGRETGIAAVPNLLVRRRHTPSQGGLNASARRRNVTGAFDIRQGLVERARGARILLVDDVFTTGATVGACTAVLLRAGAVAVDVITLARVVRPTLV